MEEQNLDFWMSKIKKMRQCPSVTDVELKIYLEKVIDICDVEIFNEDLRYLKIWCIYADLCDDPV
jgi:hypothetical protein